MSDLTYVTVDDAEPPGPTDTVVTFHGFDENDNAVTFAVDWRAGYELIEALYAGEAPMVGIEAWQVLGSPR